MQKVSLVVAQNAHFVLNCMVAKSPSCLCGIIDIRSERRRDAQADALVLSVYELVCLASTLHSTLAEGYRQSWWTKQL